MKSKSQESVRLLFNLPKDEKIYDDFGCAYKKQIDHRGRLFLTENYVCFNSNILGVKKKIVIPLKCIKEIKKKKGIIDSSIEIVREDPGFQTFHIFGSFSSFSQSYKRITAVWKSFQRNNNLNTDYSDSESSDELPEKKERSSSISDLPQEVEGASQDQEVYFPPLDTTKIFECCKVIVKLPPQTLFDLAFKDNSTETSLDKFYQTLGHWNYKTSPWKTLEEDLNSSCSISEGKNVESSIHEGNQKGNNVQIRELDMEITVTGVPFRNSTRIHKLQKYVKEGEKITFSSASSSLDVPYSNYFQVEDTWELVPLDTEKCVLRVSLYVNFIKSTMFKGTIEKRTKEEYKIEIDKWIEFMNKNNISIENFNRRRASSLEEKDKIFHGIEKALNEKDKNWYQKYYDRMKISIKEELEGYSKKSLITICIFVFIILVFFNKLSELNYYLKENNKKLDLILENIGKINKN